MDWTFDRCCLQIFLIPFLKRENPETKANASLLQFQFHLLRSIAESPYLSNRSTVISVIASGMVRRLSIAVALYR
ncbi:hypothetical protein P364_0101890 [Paenibacillus sp. MAEPY2]|nr:hypothetical protein P364_0101890 [Paenibacillus sp. MAEPY2]KGP85756.1 hypothetical protein P363_0120645 [Paenibacillus sp. MAEPY1]